MEALIAIIALALVFDYINGFHDAANSIATVVSTRVLSPRMAVLWAAAFNFIAFFFFESHVASNIAKGHLGKNSDVPLWVILSCQLAMGLGTLSGGWRIVKTMGMRLTKLKPIGGFCAETGAAGMLFLASALGVPVSTTHTITGGIVGVGWVNRPQGVRWRVAFRIVWAWLFTIQAAALIAVGIYTGLRVLGMK